MAFPEQDGQGFGFPGLASAGNVPQPSTDPERFGSALIKHMPPGAAYSLHQGSTFRRFLGALGIELGRTETQRLILDTEVTPDIATQLIPDWEDSVGLPNLGAPSPLNIAYRRQAVTARLRATLGHSKPDIVAIAASFGYDASQVSFIHFYPFRAGASAAGHRLTNRYSSHHVEVCILDFPTALRPNPEVESAIRMTRREHATITFRWAHPDGVNDYWKHTTLDGSGNYITA